MLSFPILSYPRGRTPRWALHPQRAAVQAHWQALPGAASLGDPFHPHWQLPVLREGLALLQLPDDLQLICDELPTLQYCPVPNSSQAMRPRHKQAPCLKLPLNVSESAKAAKLRYRSQISNPISMNRRYQDIPIAKLKDSISLFLRYRAIPIWKENPSI
jgi:hypothetical protein